MLISAYADDNLRIDKFVPVVFLDTPINGRSTVFLELCSSNASEFTITLDKEAEITSAPEMYQDTVACEQIISGFSPKANQIHGEGRGEDAAHFLVAASACTVRKISADQEKRHAYHITFDRQRPASPEFSKATMHLGTWLTWEQDIDPIGPRSSAFGTITVESRNATIDRVSMFVVQPVNYRKGDICTCEISSIKQHLQDEHPASLDVVYEAFLGHEFALFPAWERIFRGKNYLRNRKPIILESGQKAAFSFKLISERITRRALLLSYFLGLVFAVCGGLLAIAVADIWKEVVATGHTGVPEVALAIVSLVPCVVLGILGVRILDR